MDYILILAIVTSMTINSGTSPTITSVHFSTYEQCMAAGDDFAKVVKKEMWFAKSIYSCSKNGGQ